MSKLATLRECLGQSGVAAISMLLFLLWSVDSGFHAIAGPLYRVGIDVATAIAIWEIPHLPTQLGVADRFLVLSTAVHFLSALLNFVAAWSLSKWVYGAGPFRSLATYRNTLMRHK